MEKLLHEEGPGTVKLKFLSLWFTVTEGRAR